MIKLYWSKEMHILQKHSNVYDFDKHIWYYKQNLSDKYNRACTNSKKYINNTIFCFNFYWKVK